MMQSSIHQKEVMKAWQEFVASGMTSAHNMAVTLTFRERRKFKDGHIMWLNNDRKEAEKCVRHFLNQLNTSIYGNAARRKGKRLNTFAVYELGAATERGHIHLLIEYPDRYPHHPFHHLKFKSLIRRCWRKTFWGGPESVIKLCFDMKGWLQYIMKMGDSAIILDCLHLRREG